MKEGDHDCEFFMCRCCFNPPPDQMARRESAWREAQLADFRERRAKRVAELGLGSHRKEP